MNRHKPDEIYAYIIRYKLSHDGNSPSYRQIVDACDLSSTSVVSDHLDVLRRQGRIRLLNEKNSTARCIAVVGGRWEIETA